MVTLKADYLNQRKTKLWGPRRAMEQSSKGLRFSIMNLYTEELNWSCRNFLKFKVISNMKFDFKYGKFYHK